MRKTALLHFIILLFSAIGIYAQPVQTKVTLSSGQSLSVSIYEISFDEFDMFCKAVRKETPDDEGWEREGRPVVDISWREAIEYCNWLSRKEGLKQVYSLSTDHVQLDLQADGYRLPTEKEWMELAKAGQQESIFAGGSDIENLGWYSGNSIYSVVHPSGQKKSNSWGLYDMSGNAAEWIWDSPSDGYRLVKGGSYTNRKEFCRIENSIFREENYKIFNIGFRIVRNITY